MTFCNPLSFPLKVKTAEISLLMIHRCPLVRGSRGVGIGSLNPLGGYANTVNSTNISTGTNYFSFIPKIAHG